jgi:hypothetical protein
MVRFANPAIPQSPVPTVAVAIAHSLDLEQTRVDQKKLVIDIDLEQSVGVLPCGLGVVNALQRLLKLAISRCPPKGDMQVTACRTFRGIEIEIADSGNENYVPWMNAFSPCPPSLLIEGPVSRAPSKWRSGDANFDLYCTHCPQGGVAWSLVFRPWLYARQVA